MSSAILIICVYSSVFTLELKIEVMAFEFSMSVVVVETTNNSEDCCVEECCVSNIRSEMSAIVHRVGDADLRPFSSSCRYAHMHGVPSAKCWPCAG